MPILAVAVAIAIAASGFGARFGVWDFRVGFQVLRWGTYAGLAVAACALVALLVPATRAGRARPLALALVVASGAAALPMYWMYTARALPSINDITTDTDNPPLFVAVVPLRASAPVPSSYAGDATARAQHAGYPDLKPLIVARPPAAAFETALATARQMGWDIVAADATAGRIEATTITPWFGFHDDIVIRVAPADPGSRIDIRSVSRVGRGDLGVNARRIREFLARYAA